MRYTKLDTFHVRRKFDPSKYQDLTEFRYFIKHKRWKTICPFYVVYPWEDAPTMCKDMYLSYILNI